MFNSINEASNILGIDPVNMCHLIYTGIRGKGYNIYGFKNKDLQKFANGEPLPEVLKGIPWESFLIKEACNDYSSEGK